ncbi:hypothetical protein B9Y74_04710 [Stenotrophomonas maltophilia]|nr:hypothetical protein [Stenotrophomonas maltophilia]PJL53673.1 hypothetical protein B9Y74_04710 [Stenotrophomonas maltophilia]
MQSSIVIGISMKLGRSTGKETRAQQARLAAIKDVGRLVCHHTSVRLDDVRAEFWRMAGQNRRVA